MRKFLANVLFVATILSVPISFYIAGTIGEHEIFGLEGIIRYIWISWLFIPIGIISIFVGRMLKQRNEKYMKNYVAAFVCIPLLLLLGLYRFIPNTSNYDISYVEPIEQKIKFELPEDIKIATTYNAYEQDYNVSYVKIIDDTAKKSFDEKVNLDSKWTKDLNPNIKNEQKSWPATLQAEFNNFDYFMFYNESSGTYNSYPEIDGEYKCIFLAYDKDIGRIMIISEYTLKNF